MLMTQRRPAGSVRPRFCQAFGLLACGLAVACAGDIGTNDQSVPPGDNTGPDVTDFEPGSVTGKPAAGLRALTPSQYRASVQTVIGAAVPVEAVGQWGSSIAAARGGIAPTTVADYHSAAYSVSAWVFEDATRRDQVVGCAPTGLVGDECASEFLARVGRRAFRRPLSEDELSRWTGIAASVATALGDPARGLAHALAGLLQSPHFLYRAEFGSGVQIAPGFVAYSDHEMATRISYLVWNTTPDDVLLDVAEAGGLSSAEGISAQLERMLADERASLGLRELFADFLEARVIPELEKDADLFPSWSPALAEAMQDQVMMTAAAAVSGGDYRNLFTARTLFMNDALAPLYGLEPTFGSELVQTTLADAGPRGGLLTLPGILAEHSYPGKTSPAIRGLFVRKDLLCQQIPPPPPTVDTTLPMGDPGEVVTTRELVARHQENAACAACHGLMDPIGLALEHFDAIGGWRDTQNGLPIDPSGELDGVPFADARGLGEALAAHPNIGDCFVKNLYAFGAGRTLAPEEQATLDEFVTQFVAGGYAVRDAFRAVANSAAFRVTVSEAL